MDKNVLSTLFSKICSYPAVGKTNLHVVDGNCLTF